MSAKQTDLFLSISQRVRLVAKGGWGDVCVRMSKESKESGYTHRERRGTGVVHTLE